TWRRLRVPRPAAGLLVVALYETGSLSCPSGAGGVATVSRRRCAALVASAVRALNAHALFRRSAVAAIRRRRLRRPNRRPGAARRSRAVSRGTAARTPSERRLQRARRVARRRDDLRTLDSRDRSLAEIRRTRPPAHRHRR